MSRRTCAASACSAVALVVLGSAPAVVADAPGHGRLIGYIEETGLYEEERLNEYYDPDKASDSFVTVRSVLRQVLRFPDECVMEIVNERFEEVAPPAASGRENHYGRKEQEILIVDLVKVMPSQIYSSARPDDGTVVIIKARKGGMVSKENLFFDQEGNKNLHGLTMDVAAERSNDSPFGRLDCADQTCTRSRSFNGYGVTPSTRAHTDSLRDALVDVVRTCGGTG